MTVHYLNQFWPSFMMPHGLMRLQWVNSLRPRPNRRHFADDTFKRIFLKENVTISIKISPKCVPKSPIDNIPALFQKLAWRRPGDKKLSEAMEVSLLTHICVARPQWVKRLSVLSEASFGLWVLSLPASVYGRIRQYDSCDTGPHEKKNSSC